MEQLDVSDNFLIIHVDWIGRRDVDSRSIVYEDRDDMIWHFLAPCGHVVLCESMAVEGAAHVVVPEQHPYCIAGWRQPIVDPGETSQECYFLQHSVSTSNHHTLRGAGRAMGRLTAIMTNQENMTPPKSC